MVDTTGFVTSLVINGVIAIVAITCFIILRPKYPWCYDSRRNPQRRHTGVEPPTIPKGVFAWMGRVIRYTDSEVLETAGLDALMYIKFFEMCAQLFCVICIFGIGILLPVNYTGDGDVTDEFDKMSMANIAEGSRRFWAHLIIAYVFCGIFYYLSYHIWNDYLNLRHQFLLKWHSLGGGNTIMIHNLPAELRSDKELLKYFTKLFPGQVRSARMAKDLNMPITDMNKLKNLTENVNDRTMIESQLEQNIVAWEKTITNDKIPDAKKTRPTKALKMFCCNKVDAIDHNHAELERLNKIIAAEREKFRQAAIESSTIDGEPQTELTLSSYQNAKTNGIERVDPPNPEVNTLLTGFVTFHSTRVAYAASHYIYDISPYSFEVKMAPECRDVYWPNLNFTHQERTLRTVVLNLMTYALIVFWMIPMGFIQGISNLEELAQKYSWLDGVNSIPSVIRGFIQAYLPALTLIIFLAVVPIILHAWTRMQGVEAESWMQKSLLTKYYLFVVINFFFGAIIGTSIFGDIQALTSDISNVPTVLGQTIPKVANYFVNYVALASFAGFPLALLQIGRLLVGGIKKKYLASTPRDFEAVEAPPTINYGTEYNNHLFIFIIAITYSFISPIIIPFSAVYFLLGWFVWKYQVVHVFVQPFESGGSFWPSVYTKMSSSLFIGQLCLVGILGLKQVPAPAVLVTPLPVLTILFDRYIHGAIKAKLHALPLNQMVDVDDVRQEVRESKSYKPPSVKKLSDGAGSSTANGASSSDSTQVPTAPSSSISPPVVSETFLVRSSPFEEKFNNGDAHTNEAYIHGSLGLDGTNQSYANQAAVGFPYTKEDQDRAYVEGDIHEYIQPELSSRVPDVIKVSRVENYLSSSPNKGIRVVSEHKHRTQVKSKEESNGVDLNNLAKDENV